MRFAVIAMSMILSGSFAFAEGMPAASSTNEHQAIQKTVAKVEKKGKKHGKEKDKKSEEQAEGAVTK
ncbi:hypothetical protein [Bdellovibrio bacteriovorus]|uniref:hypothetical protein n=1 Tax=Bdellovibrio bacteriovorus TaxID=959 RepID=UPI003AA8958D